jgi:hypothetical protein
MKSIIAFVLQSVLFFIGIPIIINIILFSYSIFVFGSILKFKNLLLLDDIGLSIVLYQAFLAPILIWIFRKIKWKFIEFWSVLYLTLPITYIFYGRLKYETGDEFIGGDNLLLIIITTLIYYELLYNTYLVRDGFKINKRYRLRTIIDYFKR